MKVSVGDGVLGRLRHWAKLRDPFTPSWGEPYIQIAHRMLGRHHRPRCGARQRGRLCEPPAAGIYAAPLPGGQRLWHDPRHRQCSLASVTSLVYDGDALIDIVYSEPAGATDPLIRGLNVRLVRFSV